MQEGGRSKLTGPDRGGEEVRHIQGFKRVWTPHGDGDLFQACSAKKRDNLLVEADFFCHFRGLILFNANRSNNSITLKKDNVMAQFRDYYIPLRHPFF